MLNLLSSVAIMDDTTNAVATMVNIMEGVDGSSVFGLDTSEGLVKVEDGQTQYTDITHTLDIRIVKESAVVTVIDNVVNNNRKAYIAGYSPDGFLLYSSTNRINRNDQFDSIVANAFKSTVKTTLGYRKATSETFLRQAMYAGDNALALYDITKAVAGTSQPNGFALSATVEANFSEGTFGFIRLSTASDTPLFSPIFFPFPGVQLTASVNVTGQTGTGVIGFRWLDNEMAQISISLDDIDAEGIVSHSATAPAGTAYFQYILAPGGTSADALSFNNIMVGMGTNTRWTL